MSNREEHERETEDLESMLKQVFSDAILIQTQYSTRMNDIGDPKPHAWEMGYQSDHAYLEIDLPESRTHEIVEKLRDSLRFAIKETKKKKKGPRAFLMSLLPSPNEVIKGGNGIFVYIEPLRQLAQAGVRMPGQLTKLMQDILDCEDGWIQLKETMVMRANQKILGFADDQKAWGFDFWEDTPDRKGVQLHLNVDLEMPQGLLRGTEHEGKKYSEALQPIKDEICKRAKALGIEEYFQYDSYHYGTHGAIYGEWMVLREPNIEKLLSKLDRLEQRPGHLENTRTLFRDVILALPAKSVAPHWPIGFFEEVDERYPITDDMQGGVLHQMQEERRIFMDELWARPENAAWKAIVETFQKDGVFISDAIEMIKNPPEGWGDFCQEMKGNLLNAWPLLASKFEEPEVPGALLREQTKAQPTL